jgi:putative membrane protein
MYSGSVSDVNPGLSRIILACTAPGAGLSLAASIRTRGLRRSVVLLALGAGLPAAGELLATGPLGLLRHRLQPRVAGVPVAIVLGWYAAIHGSLTLAERLVSRLPLDEAARSRAVAPLAALIGTSLDLALDPASLDVGLWEWNADGTYAREVQGPNGRAGVPLVNYLGWFALVGAAASVYGPVCGPERGPGAGRLPERLPGRLPGLLLVPPYLAALLWAVGQRRPRYLLYSAPFPVALYAGLKKG